MSKIGNMLSLDEQYNAALDLLRRVNPRDVAKNLTMLCQQNQELAEELLSTVDQPLLVKTDAKVGKQFLCCDYNRDGDSYRSPHTDEFFPPVEDAIPLPANLRKLEVTANDAFDTYRELYYQGGLSSCYLWEQEDNSEGLAGVVLFQKQQQQSKWNSVHVFEATGGAKGQFTYRLTSTVMLDISTMKAKNAIHTDLAGSLTRQLERDMAIEQPVDHIANVGTLVEELENKLRHLLNEVYFGKMRDVLGDIRSSTDVNDQKQRQTAQKDLMARYLK